MNIYFVNKASRIPGPFDITDSCNKRILRIGDVCIRDTDSVLNFLLVVENLNKWNSCKCVSKVKYKNIELGGNSLLFSFDGLKRRVGKVTKLQIISELFIEEPVHSFLLNAIDILLYKCDLWNLEVFLNIHTVYPLSPSLVNTKNKTRELVNTPTIFYTYFSSEMKSTFDHLYKQGLSLRDVYKDVRRKYPNGFRLALLDFTHDYPTISIYERDIEGG